MGKYYVNKNAQANGDREVHLEGCAWMPTEANRIYLGYFNNCQDAVGAAKTHYAQVNGCVHCAEACHSQ